MVRRNVRIYFCGDLCDASGRRLQGEQGLKTMKIGAITTQLALSLVFSCSWSGAQTSEPTLVLPPGTAIPITFVHTLNSAKLKVGDAVITKTDQEILKPDGDRIPRGSELIGSVVNVGASPSSANPSLLAIKFDTLRVHGQSFPLHVGLRALASFADSYSSRSPAVDNGYPETSVYRQVGGDYFYRNDVVYSNEWNEVGKSSDDGVFVKLEHIERVNSPNHAACYATETLQSVGVFASSACGVYGFQDLTIDNAGADDARVIKLHSTKHTLKIASGSTALLQVIRAAQ